MFGYVTVCKNALSEQGLKAFKAYYCGLCKAIGKRCSQSARLGLSYDITFLAIVLSSVCKKEISMKDKKCVLHPIRENICVENDTALIDAYNDLEKDVKKNDYNTFKAKYEDKNAQEIKDTIREDLYTTMTFTLENAASAYNLLEIYKNKEVLDNIMYIALKAKQKSILGESNESL